jgi:chemotaxis protein methyltransferase CheR
MINQMIIDKSEFERLRAYIESECGIFLGDEKMYLVQTRLSSLAAELHCKSFDELYRKAAFGKNRDVRDRITDAITTHETSWFRDQAPFTALKEQLLPSLEPALAANKRSSLRIWSAACSTGQEPYSIALTALERFRTGVPLSPHKIEILATDISSAALAAARSGRYDELAMSRGLNEALKDRYFHKEKEQWVINDTVRSMIRFEKRNLCDDFAAVGQCDIIFCRNVLIYFSDAFKKLLLDRMATLLQPGGCLISGASESVINYSNRFRMLKYKRGLYYQAV